MYWATLETVNYRFNAFGGTKAEAIRTLRLTWEEHARQTLATWTWEDLSEDIGLTFIRVGDGLRGFDLVISGNTPKERE